MAEKFDNPLFVFKVVLEGSDPPIWRRFHMLPMSTFYEFGGIIEHAFGWHGDLYHLHKLEMDHPETGKTVLIMPAKEIAIQKNFSFGYDLIDEEKATIGEYFSMTNKGAVHTYDFGDNWRHVIELEEIKEITAEDENNDDFGIDCCVAGENQAPPEDCGGIGGYYRLMEILGDPQHSEHGEMKKWVLKQKNGADIIAGKKFDPKKLESCSIM